MAGSFEHVLDDENRNFRGLSLLENQHDMGEAIRHMAFMLLWIRNDRNGEGGVQQASEVYYQCMRGERPWPEWFPLDKQG